MTEDSNKTENIGRDGSDDLIVFDGVTKSFDGRAPIIEDTSFSVKQGEFVFLTGASGSGKTTVLNMLYRFSRPDSGDIYYRNTLISAGKINTARHRSGIGYIFQSPSLLEHRTVEYNIGLPQRIMGISARKGREQLNDVLDICCISHLRRHKTVTLSGGEKQLTALARAVINRPALILADEPTANLDRKMALMILNLLMKMNEGGTTIVFCTHDAELINTYSSRILLIKNRQITDYRLKYIMLMMLMAGFFLFNTMGLMKNLYSYAREVTFISGDRVKQEITDAFPEIATELGEVDLQEFPAYADFKFKPVSRQQIEDTLKTLKQNPAVSQILGYQDYTRQMETLLNYITYAGYGITGILLFTFFLCAYMLIQHTVYRNFDEVKVIRMLGGSSGYAVRPYLIFAVGVCSIMFFAAFGLSVLSLAWVSSYIGQTSFITELRHFMRFIRPTETLQIYISVVIFSGLGSIFSGRQSLRQIDHIIL
ncbi:hypothetical protein CHS0354_018512 [Potamilus streckersoni]|uniref:ABC transporter domain-containing protein n=1 Tax=Potamilus streckersoni TaxID=2493646 RepID=A0AAE0WA00_9BIVA|nr:hypothetical protein CHS0354_018512 [Potamilus streckersoni]